jgi:protein-arginine kinase activator protein McsA
MADIMTSQITEQVQSQVQYDRAGNITASADAKIAKMHEILQQIDELEEEFDKVRRIRDTIKQLRFRVESLGRTTNSTTDQHSQQR